LSTLPQSALNKRHNALSYHRVREAVAAKVMYFLHISGQYNPADVLTKYLGWVKFWPLVQPFFFWKGETLLHEKTPIPLLIKDLKNHGEDSPSALWGVTDEYNDSPNDVNPSGKSKNKCVDDTDKIIKNPMTQEPAKKDIAFLSYKRPK